MKSRVGHFNGSLSPVTLSLLIAVPLGLILYLPLKHWWNIYSTKRSLYSNSRYYEAVVEAIRKNAPVARFEDAFYEVPPGWDYKTLNQVDPKSFNYTDLGAFLRAPTTVHASRDRNGVLFVGFKGTAAGYNLLYCAEVVDEKKIEPYAEPGWATQLKPNWWFVCIPK